MAGTAKRVTVARRPPQRPERSGSKPTRDHYAECRGRGCAGLFLASTGVIGFCPDLVRVARDLFFGEANPFVPAAIVIAVPVLGCRGGFEAVRVGGGELAGSAISSPNRAATLLSSSIFAAPAINSFSSTPRSTKRS